jgi:hypothetical protein
MTPIANEEVERGHDDDVETIDDVKDGFISDERNLLFGTNAVVCCAANAKKHSRPHSRDSENPMSIYYRNHF